MEAFDIGELASFHLDEDPKKGTFRIIVEGKIEHADMFAHLIGNMRVTLGDLEEWSRKKNWARSRCLGSIP